MRDTATSVIRNAGVMMGSQVVTWASTFALMIVLPRYLGNEEYGRLFLAMSISMMALVFVEFGGSYFIAKEVSRDSAVAGSIVSDSIGLRIIFSVLALAVVLVFSRVVGYSGEVILLIGILTAAKVWEGPLLVIVAAFQGFERMEYRSVTSIVERLFVAVVAVSAVLAGGGSVVVAGIMGLSTFIAFLVGFRLLQKLVPNLPPIDWRALKTLIRKGIPYLMLAIFGVIYFRINAIMLSLLVPDRVVGWFGAAFRFFEILMFIPSILSLVTFPVLARVAMDRRSLARATEKSIEVITLAAVPMCIGTFVFAGDVIRLLFGFEGFAGSVAILQMLAFGLPLVYVDFVLVTTLIAADKQRPWSTVSLLAIPVSVGLNALLIPYFQGSAGNGGIGSAAATNLTELGIMVAALFMLPRDLLSVRVLGRVTRVTVAGACMALALWGLTAMHVPWLVCAAAGFVVFAAAAMSVGAVLPEELKYIRSTLSVHRWKHSFFTQKSS